MLRKTKIKIAIIAVLAVFLVLAVIGIRSLDNETLNPLEKVGRGLIFPLQKTLHSVSTGIRGNLNALRQMSEIEEENEKLRKEISRLNFEHSLYEDYILENERLHALLDFKERHLDTIDFIAARVIARSSENWHRSLILDKGAKDGLAVDMVVINHKGLIGRIVNVSGGSSEVFLITDRESAVGARIQETRQAMGVIEGQGNNSPFLRMIYISKEAEIKPGDVILSSGLGGMVPPGIRIGEVYSVEKDENGLQKNALIQPFVDFAALEEVLVVTEIFNPEGFLSPTEEEIE